jgi:ribosomal protein L35AE/L33A
MERHIRDAVVICNNKYQQLRQESLYLVLPDAIADNRQAQFILGRVIMYLCKPDRFLRPKRGPSAVKTGKGKNPRRHIKEKQHA